MNVSAYVIFMIIVIVLCILTCLYIIRYGNWLLQTQSTKKTESKPIEVAQVPKETMLELNHSRSYLIKIHGYDHTIETSTKTNISCKKIFTIIEWNYIKADEHVLSFDIFNVAGLLAESNEGVSLITTSCSQTTYRYVAKYDPLTNILNISILNNDLTPVKLSGKLNIEIILCGFGTECNKQPNDFKISNGGPIGCR